MSDKFTPPLSGFFLELSESIIEWGITVMINSFDRAA